MYIRGFAGLGQDFPMDDYSSGYESAGGTYYDGVPSSDASGGMPNSGWNVDWSGFFNTAMNTWGKVESARAARPAPTPPAPVVLNTPRPLPLVPGTPFPQAGGIGAGSALLILGAAGLGIWILTK